MLKKILKNIIIIITTLLITYGLFKFLVLWVKGILVILFMLQTIGLIYIYG